jgi:hypothetical protein
MVRGCILALTRDGRSLLLDVIPVRSGGRLMLNLVVSTPEEGKLCDFQMFSPSCFDGIDKTMIAFAVKYILYGILNIEERYEMGYSIFDKVMEMIEKIAKAHASK